MEKIEVVNLDDGEKNSLNQKLNYFFYVFVNMWKNILLIMRHNGEFYINSTGNWG